jgi:hypothetical protein
MGIQDMGWGYGEGLDVWQRLYRLFAILAAPEYLGLLDQWVVGQFEVMGMTEEERAEVIRLANALRADAAWLAGGAESETAQLEMRAAEALRDLLSRIPTD